MEYQAPNAAPVQNPAPMTMQEPETPVSVGEWLLTMLILIIPIAGIIMVFVWAFGGGAKKSKSNFFKAALIWACIWIVLWIVMVVVLGNAFWEIFNNMTIPGKL